MRQSSNLKKVITKSEFGEVLLGTVKIKDLNATIIS